MGGRDTNVGQDGNIYIYIYMYTNIKMADYTWKKKEQLPKSPPDLEQFMHGEIALHSPTKAHSQQCEM